MSYPAQRRSPMEGKSNVDFHSITFIYVLHMNYKDVLQINGVLQPSIVLRLIGVLHLYAELQLIGFLCVFYRLEELVNTIVANAGRVVSPLFEFTFKGEFLTLDWKYDIKPLTYTYGQLSNHMMEWIRTWLNPQLEDVKCHVCSPYLIPILTEFLLIHPSEKLQVFLDFIHDKYPTLPDLDITTLLVPFTCGKHWSLYVLGDQGFFHFDSLRDCGLHSDSVNRTSLAMMWAARSGYAEQSVMWRNA